MVATVTAPSRNHSRRQVVYSFDESTPRSTAVLGGKGAHLAEMVALGLPVPPGFTVSTTVARASLQHGVQPKRLSSQIDRAMRRLEMQTGKRFGDPENPLLVSVRSGAAASMPGMMDTILNLGLTPEIVEGLSVTHGANFASDVYQTFLRSYGQIVLLFDADDSIDSFMHLVPEGPREQLLMAMDAVHESWQSERAVAYRQANNLPNWWGTAVNVQAMVFGNLGEVAGTGVVFSHDLTTGQPGFNGEFLIRAQGEELVSGMRTPQPIADLATLSPVLYNDLERYVLQLAEHLDDAVDVEFTIEDGRLYLLQVRRAKRMPRAAVTIAVHKEWKGRLTREEAVASIAPSVVAQLGVARFGPEDLSSRSILARGVAASHGAAVGTIAMTRSEVEELVAVGEPAIFVAFDTSPEDLPVMLVASAIVTANGGSTCHAAVVARELGLPAVVGIGKDAFKLLFDIKKLSVDGNSGSIYRGEVPLHAQALSKEENIFLRWCRRVERPPRIGFEYLVGLESANEWLNNFYLSDAMATAAKGSVLEREVAELRATTHCEIAEKFAAYLTMAVSGEVRHAFDSSIYYLNASAFKPQAKQFSVPTEYMDREPAQAQICSELRQRSLEDHQRFFEWATQVFSVNGWDGGYGGKKWAAIAQAVMDYLSGELSPTMFVDHAFDLRHNGGALFDKHLMTGCNTEESVIVHQLNVKKSESDPSRLKSDLEKYACFASTVMDMFQRGKTLGLW